MQLYRVIVPVSSITVAVTFYSHLLGIEGFPVSPSRHYFNCEGTILVCFDPLAQGNGVEARPNQEPLYFAVDDLEAILERAKSLDCGLCDDIIGTRPWGERSFYAADPFGNPLCFVERATIFTGG